MFHLRAALATASVLTAAAVLVACSSGRTEASAPTTASPAATAPETTTAVETTTAPEPITAEERAWVRSLHKLQKRLEKTAFRSGVVTERSLLYEANVYDGCRKSLDKTPSARFAKPYAIAKKACEKFDSAAAELTEAAANLDASGAVVVGSVEEDRFDRAFKRGTALVGNAVNTMSAAVTKADAIRNKLPS
jgi:hypothetical protein